MLRPYQKEVARAVLRSISEHKGLTISVEIARQGGKNELSAQLEVLLLTMFMARGGNAIKCSPTFKPQTVISMMRLRERLDEYGFSPASGIARWAIYSLWAQRTRYSSRQRNHHPW